MIIKEIIGVAIINPRGFLSIDNDEIKREVLIAGFSLFKEFISLFHQESNPIIISNVPLLKLKSLEEFWMLWNRFKKLKALI